MPLYMKAFLMGFLSVFFLCFSLAHASQLSVSPTYFEFENPAGQTVSENIVVYNSADETMTAKLYVGDFWYDKEGKRSFPNAGSTPYSGASWISLPQKEVLVPAHGQLSVPFTFSIPAGAPTSGFATVFVERGTGLSPQGKKTNVNIALRIAVPILYKRPDADPNQLKLSSFSVARPTQFKPLLLKFILDNEDNTHVFPEGNVTIVKAGSKEFVAKDEVKHERVVLPKQKADYEMTLPLEPKSGKYEGLLTLFYGKEKSIVKSFKFSIP